MPQHKYDPEQYSIILFDQMKRKVKELLPTHYLEAEQAGEDWAKETGGTYVINYCMKNSEIPRRQRWQKQAK